MFKNILVASDGSKCGDKAVDMAIDLASKYGAKISALYVMDFALDFSYDDLDDAGGAVLDEITAKGKEKDVVVVEHIITADPINEETTMVSEEKYASGGKMGQPASVIRMCMLLYLFERGRAGFFQGIF